MQTTKHSKSDKATKVATKAKPAAKAAADKPAAKAKVAAAKAPKAPVEAKAKPAAPKASASANRGEGARALSSPTFVVNRKWTKPVESAVGHTLRVELPENRLKGMSWQLQKLPHGVALTQSEVRTHAHEATQAHSMSTQDRVFDFSVEEEGDYLLQFTLGRPFAQAGFVDQFRVKLNVKKD